MNISVKSNNPTRQVPKTPGAGKLESLPETKAGSEPQISIGRGEDAFSPAQNQPSQNKFQKLRKKLSTSARKFVAERPWLTDGKLAAKKARAVGGALAGIALGVGAGVAGGALGGVVGAAVGSFATLAAGAALIATNKPEAVLMGSALALGGLGAPLAVAGVAGGLVMGNEVSDSKVLNDLTALRPGELESDDIFSEVAY